MHEYIERKMAESKKHNTDFAGDRKNVSTEEKVSILPPLTPSYPCRTHQV